MVGCIKLDLVIHIQLLYTVLIIYLFHLLTPEQTHTRTPIHTLRSFPNLLISVQHLCYYLSQEIY